MPTEEEVINILREKQTFMSAEQVAKDLKIEINHSNIQEIKKTITEHPKVKTITGASGKYPLHCYYYTGEYAKLKNIEQST